MCLKLLLPTRTFPRKNRPCARSSNSPISAPTKICGEDVKIGNRIRRRAGMLTKFNLAEEDVGDLILNARLALGDYTEEELFGQAENDGDNSAEEPPPEAEALPAGSAEENGPGAEALPAGSAEENGPEAEALPAGSTEENGPEAEALPAGSTKENGPEADEDSSDEAHPSVA